MSFVVLPNSERVLVLPPTQRDAQVTTQTLEAAGLSATNCGTITELVDQMARGAAVLLLTEDSFLRVELPTLLRAIKEQPAWSDIPVIVLMRRDVDASARADILRSLRNVTLLDRPTATRVLVSAVEVGVRSRRHQYEIRDLIEQEKAARQDAEGATRSKDEFLAVVSHELRTPLNSILGWSQILKRKADSPEIVREGLDAIERGARSQARLIEDLLDMSRVVSGKLRLDLRNISPAAIVQAAVETIKLDAEARNLTVEVNIDDAAGPVLGDAERLQQVVRNLLSNAVKFTPPPGNIRVSLSREGDFVRIEVADTGIGIDPLFLPHVFDQFSQADASSKRTFGGLGLGLAIVRQIVELHSGSVVARSPGRSKGSTFVVTLPILRSAVGPDEGGSDPAEDDGCNGHDFSGLSIMVVDDDWDAVEVVRTMLQDCKARVLSARSAPEALEILETQEPDVLVSDIGMPEMDGIEMIREVRRKGRQMPAIAVTAFARADDQARALDAGFNRHLAKPVEPNQLLDVIDSLVQTNGHKRAPIFPG